MRGRFAAVVLVAVHVALAYSLGVPCLWRALLGIPCPGCGMTRATISLLCGDFVAAAEYHFMVYAMPLIVICVLREGKIFGNAAIPNRIAVCLIVIGTALRWILNLCGILSA